MSSERRPVNSRRSSSLTRKFVSERYRHAYVAAHVRQFLARQIRALRGPLSQEEFAEQLQMPQSSVSRLENPAKGMQLQTLFDVASKLDRAVIVRIVDFATFLRFTGDQSDLAICPPRYDQERAERALKPPSSQPATSDEPLVEVEDVEDQDAGPTVDVVWKAAWRDEPELQLAAIN